MLVNYKISINSAFCRKIRDVAYNKFKMLSYCIENKLKNGSYGYFSTANRNWTLGGVSINKNLKDNLMLLDTFVEIYKITNIETYHTKILDLLDFIQN
ncbi:MAG: hypothetical protein ACTSRP_25555, partial [Candidatus Helarchaeota archaeon]